MTDRELRRVFSYDEAASLLPEVQRLTLAAQEEVRAAGRALSPTDTPSPAVQQELSGIVQRWSDRIVALGLEVKGLWLVDFDNGSGYYCWHFPETSLQFYHSYDEGFGGRMRIQ
jgi:hypothetical protein